jgi:hypothetical protein
MPVIMVPDLLFSTDEMQRLSEGIFPDLFAVLDALIESGVIPADCRTGMAVQPV